MAKKQPQVRVPADDQWRLDRLSNERLAQKYLVPLEGIKLIANGKRVRGVSTQTYLDIQEELRYRDKLRTRLQKPL